MDRQELGIRMEPDYFGPLWRYVRNDKITDIDYNGNQLWITDVENERYLIRSHGITEKFVEQFSHRIANEVSKPFNKKNNLLEAETDTLRISIVHESVAISGRSICIRKSMPMLRMQVKKMVEDEYVAVPVLELLTNCVAAKMNFVFCGEPGAGKTECAKFFSQFIPAGERVITIEDNPEWHYSQINPGKDCVELRINPDFDYTKAIKTCLRQNPSWIMLSEARSTEVKSLLECWSTGIRGFTTLHTHNQPFWKFSHHKIAIHHLHMYFISSFFSYKEADLVYITVQFSFCTHFLPQQNSNINIAVYIIFHAVCIHTALHHI